MGEGGLFEMISILFGGGSSDDLFLSCKDRREGSLM